MCEQEGVKCVCQAKGVCVCAQGEVKKKVCAQGRAVCVREGCAEDVPKGCVK